MYRLFLINILIYMNLQLKMQGLFFEKSIKSHLIFVCKRTPSMQTLSFYSPSRLRAFSLPELLVVLVIIGILVLIALPNLMPLISRAKATEAQQQLTYLHTLQRSNFYTYSRYSTSLEELGFEQSKLVTDGGQANYLIEIVEASDHGFRATATAVVDFDGDGVYNVWEIDQDKALRETVKD